MLASKCKNSEIFVGKNRDMAKKAKAKLPPLEGGLLTALKAIDNQVARAMQRSPEEKEEQGVQKWEPYNTRVENITALLLNALGDGDIELDGLLVLSQATSKTLNMLVGDLGEAGLGKMRSSYCREALKNIGDDISRAVDELQDTRSIN